MSEVTDQNGGYLRFCSMQVGVFLLPLDGVLVHCKVTPSSKMASTHLYTWVKRGTVRVKSLVQDWTSNRAGLIQQQMSSVALIT